MPSVLDHNAAGKAALKNAGSSQATPALIHLPQQFAASDATIIRSRFDSNSMPPSNLDYKIVILFFLPLPPQKLTSLTTGKLSQFSLTP